MAADLYSITLDPRTLRDRFHRATEEEVMAQPCVVAALDAAGERERDRCLAIARGCVEDYQGGYSGDRLSIFRHGMLTVVAALAEADPNDPQTRALESLGRAHPKPAPAEPGKPAPSGEE